MANRRRMGHPRPKRPTLYPPQKGGKPNRPNYGRAIT